MHVSSNWWGLAHQVTVIGDGGGDQLTSIDTPSTNIPPNNLSRVDINLDVMNDSNRSLRKFDNNYISAKPNLIGDRYSH